MKQVGIDNVPLGDLRVLDFSTLLPGPLATLYLLQAGAEVIKVEHPNGGDSLRRYPPFKNGSSVLFELVNAGKKSLGLDLKDGSVRPHLLDLIRTCDVVVEQFRPGVMDRLGLGYDELKVLNPGLIYCSISGYGQSGPYKTVAGHDLNYQAWSGLIAVTRAVADGGQIVPALIADIAGGAHAAVINILLALRTKDRTNRGSYLDIAMVDGLFPFMLSSLANHMASRSIAEPRTDILTGQSPRYQLYPTADDRFLAAAPLEDHFWARFTELIGLPEEFKKDDIEASMAIDVVASIIASEPAIYWEKLFEKEEVCCNIVRNLSESLEDIGLQMRGVVDVGAKPTLQLTRISNSNIKAEAPSFGEDNISFGFAAVA